MKRSLLSFVLIIALLALSGCGLDRVKNEKAGEGGEASKGTVFFLNFKPESENEWTEMAQKFTKETGIDMRIETAASGTYEKTLRWYMGNNDYPSLFQINGDVGYDNWKDYIADLSETSFYDLLQEKKLAIERDGKVYAVPSTIEGYGIIYNNKIMKKYFALEDRKEIKGVHTVRDIQSFSALKQVVEDMTEHKDELGIDGVFGATSMESGNQWRWNTHLLNVPLAREYKEKKVISEDTISFTYADEMKNLFDLYLNNSSVPRVDLTKYSVTSSMKDFAQGKCAMIQNGNWAWSEIETDDDKVLNAEDVGMLPLYMGLSDEEFQGLCVGTENYWCVNSYVSPDDQAATLAFIDWYVTSQTGKDYATNKLGMIMPFSSFKEEERPKNPLARAVLEDVENSSTTSVPWIFTTFPGEDFKDEVGNSLLTYIYKNGDWAQFTRQVKASWAKHRQLEAKE